MSRRHEIIIVGIMFIVAGAVIGGGSNTQIFGFPIDFLTGVLLGAGIGAAAGGLAVLIARRNARK